MNLRDLPIGDDHPCFIVAEIGQNHNGRQAVALDLIGMAADAGASAVKFCIWGELSESFTAQALAAPYAGPQSFGQTYGEHRVALTLPIGLDTELKEYAESLGLMWFATACSQSAVARLEALETPLYKVASRDLTNLPLIKAIAQTRKPVILSSGMGGLKAIADALATVREVHDQVVLCQCTSSYPCDYADVNIRAVQSLRKRFGVLTGMSDHTVGIMVPIVAAALGAVLVEKHITLARTMKGTDHAFSLEADGLRRVVRDIRGMEQALGDGVKRFREAAADARDKLGRSVTTTKAIAAGDFIGETYLRPLSPGTGIPWKQRQRAIGQRAARNIAAGQTITDEDVS